MAKIVLKGRVYAPEYQSGARIIIYSDEDKEKFGSPCHISTLSMPRVLSAIGNDKKIILTIETI